MNDIVIQTIFSGGTLLLATLTAFFTARHEAKRNRYLHTEKIEDSFSEMCKKVGRYLTGGTNSFALESVCSVRPYFDEKIADALDSLQAALEAKDRTATKKYLDIAVREYRIHRPKI